MKKDKKQQQGNKESIEEGIESIDNVFEKEFYESYQGKVIGKGKLYPSTPFKPLPDGPLNTLFWQSIGIGKDYHIFQNLRIYPYDRLDHDERILVLSEVAEAMSSYKLNKSNDDCILECNILTESVLYYIFALLKARIKKEIDLEKKVLA